MELEIDEELYVKEPGLRKALERKYGEGMNLYLKSLLTNKDNFDNRQQSIGLSAELMISKNETARGETQPFLKSEVEEAIIED